MSIISGSAKDPSKAKYQFLINESESIGLKYYNDFQGFAKYSNDMDDTYENTEETIQIKQRKILIVFGDMIAHILSNIIGA